MELDFTDFPDGRVLEGIEAFRRFRAESPWTGELVVELEEVIEVDADRVLSLVRIRSTAPTMEAELEGRFAHLMEFEGEVVVRWKLYVNRDDAARAAGLGPA